MGNANCHKLNTFSISRIVFFAPNTTRLIQLIEQVTTKFFKTPPALSCAKKISITFPRSLLHRRLQDKWNISAAITQKVVSSMP